MRRFFLVNGVGCALFVVLAQVGFAQYSVDRTVEGDPLACGDASSITVKLTGGGEGSVGDMVTVKELLVADLNAYAPSNISDGGSVEDLFQTIPETPVGSHFQNSVVLGPPCGQVCTDGVADPGFEINVTTALGGNTYEQTARGGADVWADGDVCTFAYSRINGDFDISVRIDDKESSAGPNDRWGKFGLMARQSLDCTSRMVYLHDSLPENEGGAPNLQPTRLSGRLAHLPAPGNLTDMFEESDCGHITPGCAEAPPTCLCHPAYLRLVRNGGQVQGFISDDPEVEASPTDASLWTHVNSLLSQAFFDASESDCYYVGFATSERHPNCDDNRVEFTVLNFEGNVHSPPENEICTNPALGREITWTVPRSELNEGLTYDIGLTGSSRVVMGTTGTFDDGGGEVDIGGLPSVEIVDIQSDSVGAFSARRVGPSGDGTVEFDGIDTYTMTGIGSDIWRGGDNMLYLYEEVVGDFEATASFSSISWGNAGAWGKTGLMARPSCHDDARNDHILFNNVTTNEQASGGARHAHRLFDRSYSAAGRTDPCGNDPWNEPYVIGPEGMNPHGSIPGRPSANEGQDFLLDKPQHLKIIRIDDLIQSYVSWDDPDEPGEPAHWIHVASLNLVGRQDAHTVGMGMNSLSGVAVNGPSSFTMDVQEYTTPEFASSLPNKVVFEQNFDAIANGSLPNNSFTGSRGPGGETGAYRPQVVDGKLRMSEDGIEDAATAVWFTDEALNDMLDTGFVAEWDVHVTTGNGQTAGEGGMFAVVASATDLLTVPTCDAGGTVIESFDNLGLLVGEDIGDDSESTVDDGGTPDDPSDDIYTNRSSTGGEVWNTCDDFRFDFTSVTGDFDVAVEIISQDHDSGGGQWGKQGIMAREVTDTRSRFYLVNDSLPSDDDTGFTNAADEGTYVTFRTELDPDGSDCPGTQEIKEGFEDGFLRLTRRGNTLQGWFSDDPGLGDGSMNPHNDCNWIAGTPRTLDSLESELFVGMMNSDHMSAGSIAQTVVYRILPENADGVVNTPSTDIDFVGYPEEMGWGHLEHRCCAANGEPEAPQTGIKGRTEGRPMLAVEVDTTHTINGPCEPDEIEGAGSPDNPGKYHIGLNLAGNPQSRQTNEQFGVDSDDLPDVFASGAHLRFEYRPNGKVSVFASPIGQEGGGSIKIIDTVVAPMSFGAGLADPMVGFVASSGPGTSQTMEFDNLTITGGAGGGTGFRRGDCDQSGKVDFNDAIFHLRFLFLGENDEIVNGCKDACDSDDSGSDDFTDDINTLRFLFLGQGSIPEPGPLPDETHPCGADPTVEAPEELTCETYEAAVACP